ncbi:pyridoxal phosphate-dependent aminotransferase family protein [Streptomyces pactum]|uniref:8-amino-7-oxononanoate synthase n=1 Tax=Streptomyces pactum TaxID=68249 RepID=A0ABS0NK13_9ACTN|nr:pyridoxal phosphate-dependent aminotransferase family protein [Streptomyces pactum]MBH5335531.1 pyridoxal phosphate-dependent aminotransferase family protein [Streptomyces pactum]
MTIDATGESQTMALRTDGVSEPVNGNALTTAALVDADDSPFTVSAEADERDNERLARLLRLLEQLGDEQADELLRYGDSLKWDFSQFAQGMRRFGLNKVPFTEGMSGIPEVRMDGRNLVNFAPVNFLNLHSRPDVMDTFVDAARTYGLATGGARISQGVTRPHMDMEDELCRILGKERAISYATGMVANVGFIHAMSNRQVWAEDMAIDFTDVVFVFDRDNHWSLWKAAEKLEYGKQLFSFRHNNVAHLESILKKLQGKRVVVVFESVYSIDGSVAPMHEIVDVCEKYGALSYVDDANGFLVYGAPHRPFAQEYAGMLRSTFIMVSLKKSVGLEGGMIAGPSDAIWAMEALGMASVFTAQVQPPTAATAAYSMRLLTENEPEIIDNYLSKVADFRGMLSEEGFQLNPTPSIMTSIDVGPESKGMAIRDAFLERGYRVPVYLFPAARRNHATLRLILNATHTDEQILGFINLMREFRTEFDL